MKYLLLLASIALFSCSNTEQEKPLKAAPNTPSISSNAKEKIDQQVSLNAKEKTATPPRRHRLRMGNIPGEVQGYFDGETLKRIEGELLTESGKEFDTYVYKNGALISSTHYQYFNSFAGKEAPFAIEQKLYYTAEAVSQVESRSGTPQNEKLDHVDFVVSNPDMNAIQGMYGARLTAYSRALGQGQPQ
jgi:hypothetical protein